MAKVPLNPRMSAYANNQQITPQVGMSYDDLHEGPINPKDIQRNGSVLFSFVNQIARGVAETEGNELAVRGFVGSGKDKNSLYHSKIPELERVGKDMERMMNQGFRERQMSQMQSYEAPVIEVPLENLLNYNKAFENLTQGYNRPVIQNNYNDNKNLTMSEVDISEYLGGTPKRSVQSQSNNTFYINMDKTSKAILVEQQKTNKLLGVLVQSIRENGIKIEELPQSIAEVLAASKIDPLVADDETYEKMESTVDVDDDVDVSFLP